MERFKNAWAVRPMPHGKPRLREFLSQGMVAIGWPSTGDLTGSTREQIRQCLRKAYYAEASTMSLGQATGIVDRFVNQMSIGDAVIVPDGGVVYIGELTGSYTFRFEFEGDNQGYPHWRHVRYLFDGKPVARAELPAILFDALKGRQSVFGLPVDCVCHVADNPSIYRAFERTPVDEVKEEYISLLSQGRMPGINSTRFEVAVCKLMSLYFPGLQRLPTTNAPEGADTDLMTTLPGQVTIRIQVKCFQDLYGPLRSQHVEQLRNSMDVGEHGIVVTTNLVSEDARRAAEEDATKPVSIINGPEFADLVFEQIESLDDEDLWDLGLKLIPCLRR